MLIYFRSYRKTRPEKMSRSKTKTTRKKPGRFTGGGWLLASAGGLLAVALALMTPLLHGNKRVGSLPSVDGEYEDAYVPRQSIGGRSYREVAETREPVILTGSVADQWLARHKFTASFLSQKLPHVMAYRQEEKRSFITFHDGKPLEPLVNEKWEEFNIKVNTTIPDILRWDSPGGQREGPFLYFSQDVSSLRTSFPDIAGYLQPIQDLILSKNNVQVNLWIGRKGLITHTHYDCTYNFFVQLRGRKKFTLFPPNHTLYLYPCLHPHYGHSQVDILEPNSDLFPHYSRAGAVVVEVGPGDMLVVPPFWFHHVETIMESVSVNVWSDAPEYELINQIYSQPVPFEEEWGWDELMKATKVYMEMILEAIEVKDAQLFVRELLEQRYTPVIQSGNLIVNISLVEELKSKCLQINWQDERLKYNGLLRRGVDNLTLLFLQIPVRATQKICLANFIEHLTYSILGLHHVYPFLQSCVSF